MNLLAFIIPYFGKLPKEMEYFLLSVKYNPSYNWIIITDDLSDYQYPDIVRVIHSTFSEVVRLIQSKFDFPISLKRPQKLCDYKPAYGFIFDDYLSDYEYWGYCDLDQYFGNLSNWLTEEYLNQYDRLFSLGHMTIYRNVPRMNYLFTCDDQRCDIAVRNYKDVFSNEKNMLFDEIPRNQVSINSIALQQKIRQSFDWFALDILPFKSYFCESYLDVKNIIWSCSKPDSSTIIIWREGKIFLYKKDSNGVKKREVMKVHKQKRSYHITPIDKNIHTFAIIPNRIIPSNKPFDNRKLNYWVVRNKIRKILHIDEINREIELIKHIFINKIKNNTAKEDL